MTDWRTWLTIALVGAPCLGYVVLLLAEAQGRRETGRSPLAGAVECVRALPCTFWTLVTHTMWRPREWRAWWYADVYPPEAAEAPDDVMGVADGLGFQRSTWWTGQPLAGRRLPEDYIVRAEADMDWHAAEHMVRRVR